MYAKWPLFRFIKFCLFYFLCNSPFTLLSPHLLFLPNSRHYKRFLICLPNFSSASKKIYLYAVADLVILFTIICRCSSRSLSRHMSLACLDLVLSLILPFALPNYLLAIHFMPFLPPVILVTLSFSCQCYISFRIGLGYSH